MREQNDEWSPQPSTCSLGTYSVVMEADDEDPFYCQTVISDTKKVKPNAYTAIGMYQSGTLQEFHKYSILSDLLPIKLLYKHYPSRKSEHHALYAGNCGLF